MSSPTEHDATQELIEEFVEIGLEEPEARVYIQLARMGPSKVRTVAEAAGTQRTKTYRVLDGLEQRGFVKETMESPTRYEAEPSQRVFERLLAEEKRRIEQLDKARGLLVPQLERLRATQASPPTEGPSFRTLNGRASIYRTLSEMFDRSDDRARVISTHPSALGFDEVPELRESLLPRLQAGEVALDIVFGTDVELPDELVTQVGKIPAVRARRWSTDRTVRFLLEDDRSVLMFVVSDPEGALQPEDEVAIWTDAPALVESQLALFETAWAAAEPLGPDED